MPSRSPCPAAALRTAGCRPACARAQVATTSTSQARADVRSQAHGASRSPAAPRHCLAEEATARLAVPLVDF